MKCCIIGLLFLFGSVSFVNAESISAPFNGSNIVVSTSTRTAGAIDSITWNGVEFVNSYDHGREFQSAVTLDGKDECNNPTEAGSRADGLGATSSSVLNSISATGNTLLTNSNPAWWLTDGQTSANCHAGPSTGVGQPSDSTLNKQVTIGASGVSNAIKYDMGFSFPTDHTAARFEIIAGYTRGRTFTTLYKFDPTTNTMTALDSSANQPYQSSPLILSTADSSHAIGLIAINSPSIVYAAAQFVEPTRSDADATRKINCAVFQTPPVPAGSYNYTCYIVVGTLADVKSGMLGLATTTSGGGGTSTFSNNINMRDGTVIPQPDVGVSAPIVVAGQSRSITTKTPPVTNGQNIGTALAATGGTPDDWAITNCGGCAGFFDFQPSGTAHTGQLRVANAAALNAITAQTTYSPIVQASNTGGQGTATVTIIATPASASSPPVISAVSSPKYAAVPATGGNTITTLTASNIPTSWTITNGNTTCATGFDYNIPTSGSAGDGLLQWGNCGAADYSGNVGLKSATLTVTANNSGGSSAPVTFTVNAYADGSAQAPPGAAPYPSALAPFGTAPGVSFTTSPQNVAYLRRPPWKVVGVDFPVGPNSTPTINPTSIVNGTTLTISGTTFNIHSSSATPIVITGVDFSLGGIGNGGGYQLDIAAPNVTIRNCKFGYNYGGEGGDNIFFGSPTKSLTMEYNVFDHRNWNWGNGAQGAGGYVLKWGGQSATPPTDVTIRFNWFRGIPNHILSSTFKGNDEAVIPPAHLIWKYNLISDHGEGAPGAGGGPASLGGSHFNATEWGGIPLGSTWALQFNTALYVPFNADNQTYQSYPNNDDGMTSTSAADFGWNTFMAPQNPHFLRDPGTAASNPPGNLVDQGCRNASTGASVPCGAQNDDSITKGWTNLNTAFAGPGGTGASFKTTYHDNYYEKSGSICTYCNPGYNSDPHSMVNGYPNPKMVIPPNSNWDMLTNGPYPPQ